ncbi:MAG: ATP-binding protein [Phycisphaerae bacterium]|nr:ATP-binding protein [Phycisphaerae bacterium]MDD5380433.1 ATP-binding protein [Phycisphaerae bacterium]
MKEIVVISGKGGTGKTSIVASFAALAKNAVLADCDVDAADLHLILQPDIKQTSNFSGGKRASVITEKCVGCGRCEEVCNFNAPLFNGPANEVAERTYTIDPIACEGCKVCVKFCPVDAIEFKDAVNGQWFVSDTRFGPMVHAKLGIAQENSGKLVSLIRKEAKRIAAEQDKSFVIVDGSPGIGCSVIASITGADLVLVVTEPTLSGQHDLDRVVELTGHFGIPTAICINKYDINTKIAEAIETKAGERNLDVVGKISYDTEVTRAQLVAKSVVEYSNGRPREQIVSLWQRILSLSHKK